MIITSACCDSCGSGAGGETQLAVACTLRSADFQERVGAIRELARRSLRTARREPLRLHLNYSSNALAEVEALVAMEEECCAFLEFDLQHDSQAVRLVITAPIDALTAADELFAHFAPELASESA